MKNLKHIFFDLDHTLWDFDKNSTETLYELFNKYQFKELHNIDFHSFTSHYHLSNRELWELFNHNKITKEELRELRLQKTFSALNIEHHHIPPNFNEEYISTCPYKGNLFPYAKEILEKYHTNYHLHILSNGFADIQEIKIRTSGISEYFQNVFTAEEIGFKKPYPEFYNFVLNKIKAHPSECIMIGDTLEADVLGPMRAGIKAVYFNPEKTKHSETIDYEINQLSELKNIIF